jgi:hypothetical protein
MVWSSSGTIRAALIPRSQLSSRTKTCRPLSCPFYFVGTQRLRTMQQAETGNVYFFTLCANTGFVIVCSSNGSLLLLLLLRIIGQPVDARRGRP